MTALAISLRLLIGLLLILANGFFVAVEFALTRARQFREEEFDEPGLRRAWEMTHDLEIYLTSCQVGITATSIALGIVAEPALSRLLEPLFANTALATVGLGAVLAFVIINLVHLTHGEQTPTYLGVERSKTVCRYGAAPLYWFTRTVRPLIMVGDRVAKATLRLFGVRMSGAWLETGESAIETRAELRNRLDTVLSEGGVTGERHDEVMNALDIDDLTVAEVMIPGEEMVVLSTEVDVEENFRRMAEHPRNRYPLVGDGISDLRGIIYFPVLARHREAWARGELDFSELAAPPMTLEADTTVSQAIDQFQDRSQEMAIVLENGRVQGLITVTDALEAVMGEIEDPLDRAEELDGAARTGGSSAE